MYDALGAGATKKAAQTWTSVQRSICTVNCMHKVGGVGPPDTKILSTGLTETRLHGHSWDPDRIHAVERSGPIS